MTKVKILWFVESQTENAERKIEAYLNNGWRIVAAGGNGFVVLQKDDEQPLKAADTGALARRLSEKQRSSDEETAVG